MAPDSSTTEGEGADRGSPAPPVAHGAATAAGPGGEADAKLKRRALAALNMSMFLSVFRMVLTVQAEPLMVRKICKDDMAKTMRLLGNTSAFINVLALFFNQLCGKLSDSIGRKRLFLLSPLANLATDLLTFARPTESVVLACRVLRAALASVSASLMTKAAMMDVCSGQELAIASSRLGSVVGAAVLAAPFLETLVLQRTGGPRAVYLAGVVMSVGHLLYNGICMPETLEASKRLALKACFTLQTLNPFAFTKIFTHCSGSVKRLSLITTLQMAIEGKNMADFEEVWKREHLGWGTEMCRNEIVVYGICCTVAGETVHPYLLKNLSPRAFTTLTNWTNALAFGLRGLVESGLFFLGSSAVLLPGVNGSSAEALAALASEHAAAEGVRSGEFSAWTQQLRALTRAITPAIIGNYYAFCRQRGIYPGTTFMLVGALGSLLPQALLAAWAQPRDLKPPEVAAQADRPLAGVKAPAGDPERPE